MANTLSELLNRKVQSFCFDKEGQIFDPEVVRTAMLVGMGIAHQLSLDSLIKRDEANNVRLD